VDLFCAAREAMDELTEHSSAEYLQDMFHTVPTNAFPTLVESLSTLFLRSGEEEEGPVEVI
jgi:hypothetical protein